jgi:hypothetical protein
MNTLPEDNKPASPAEKRAQAILCGVRIIQKHNKKVSLIGLDKGVYVGPLESPERDLSFTTDDVKQLKKLGWCWSEEQESWEFYTGHG